jgi:hypothetical protein
MLKYTDILITDGYGTVGRRVAAYLVSLSTHAGSSWRGGVQRRPGNLGLNSDSECGAKSTDFRTHLTLF